MKSKKLYFFETHVAGRQYHDCDEAFNELAVGTVLRMERDEFNAHDPNAVQLVYDKIDACGKKDSFLIGYLPANKNETIAGFLDMGWECAFECRISRINPEEHYERQLHVTVKIVRNAGE